MENDPLRPSAGAVFMGKLPSFAPARRAFRFIWSNEIQNSPGNTVQQYRERW